jgi:fructosamine-3-kinase
MLNTNLITGVMTMHGLDYGKVSSVQSLGGGSINEVLLLNTSCGKLVLKVNSTEQFPGMFQAEADGLKALNVKNGPRIPQVILVAEMHGYQFLFLEYIEPGRRIHTSENDFAVKLANLHMHSAPQFGWTQNNYMGSLQQINDPCDTAAEFFAFQRVMPQWKIAYQSHSATLPAGPFENMIKRLPEIIPEEKPALIHGDLWNGNRIIDPDGNSVLIDPAVSYGSREADLAMTALFGGFGSDLLTSYHLHFPLEPGFPDRADIWNLYPLLIHLNLFGSGYIGQILQIIRRF